MSVVYDTGALIGADRSERALWADHRARLLLGVLPVVTAPVVAQASRSPRQVQLRRFLRGCEIVDFTGNESHDVGSLLERTGTSDVVDAHVVLTAANLSAIVLTSDPEDLRVVSDAFPRPIKVVSSWSALSNVDYGGREDNQFYRRLDDGRIEPHTGRTIVERDVIALGRCSPSKGG